MMFAAAEKTQRTQNKPGVNNRKAIVSVYTIGSIVLTFMFCFNKSSESWQQALFVVGVSYFMTEMAMFCFWLDDDL